MTRRRSGEQERRAAEAFLGEPVTRVFTIRKDGRPRTIWRADHTDDNGPAVTFDRLVAEFGLNQVDKIIKAAPNGILPGLKHGRRLVAHAEFCRLWDERDPTKPLQTGRLARLLRVTNRTIERWAEAEQVRHE